MARLSRADVLETMIKNVPVQHFGEVKDIADATIFLFSPAGDFISGDVIVVDGGAWHRQGTAGYGMPYPECVLSDGIVEGVRGMKRESKL